jgi:putative flippase GtrA
MDQILSFIKTKRIIILYGIIGVSAVVVDYVFFVLFYNVFEIKPVVATVLSVAISTVYAFTLNKKYNFKTNDFTTSRFVMYALVSLTGMLTSALVIEFLSRIHIDPNIAKAISLPPIVVMQYILNKQFTFNEKFVSLKENISNILTNKKHG